MALHESFKPLLGMTISGFVYLQHELEKHVDIDYLERIMQKILLKHSEPGRNDRRNYSPFFTFQEMGNCLRMNFHRPDVEEKPGEIVTFLDFIEYREKGNPFPTLQLLSAPWHAVTKGTVENVSLNTLRGHMRILNAYVDPTEYSALTAFVGSFGRMASGQPGVFRYNLIKHEMGVDIVVLRNGKHFVKFDLLVNSAVQ